MATDRWKATVVLSSDHAGINAELDALEGTILHTLAQIEDPRKVRDYLRHLVFESGYWCGIHYVDDRGWIERTRKMRG